MGKHKIEVVDAKESKESGQPESIVILKTCLHLAEKGLIDNVVILGTSSKESDAIRVLATDGMSLIHRIGAIEAMKAFFMRMLSNDS